MTDTGIPESRFYMWRAVVAVAHLDNRIAGEEEKFIDQYLAEVPFNTEQREMLTKDLQAPKPISMMFDMIKTPEDQSDFFQFARMLTWCDGDLDEQESRIMDILQESHMEKIDHDALEVMVRNTRHAGRIQRVQEKKDMMKSLGGVFKFFFGKDK